MIPYLLAAVGGYLIGDSMKDQTPNIKYAKGGSPLNDLVITDEYMEFDHSVFNELPDDDLLYGLLVKEGDKKIGIVRAEEDILSRGVGYIFGIDIFESKRNQGYGRRIIQKVFEKYPNQESFGGKATDSSREFWIKIGADMEDDNSFILERDKLKYKKGGRVWSINKNY